VRINHSVEIFPTKNVEVFPTEFCRSISTEFIEIFPTEFQKRLSVVKITYIQNLEPIARLQRLRPGLKPLA
jgi:hypothetical protein